MPRADRPGLARALPRHRRAGGQEEGADGVILGCTEIGLLLSQGDVDVPVFDTTALHVAAALDFVEEWEAAAA